MWGRNKYISDQIQIDFAFCNFLQVPFSERRFCACVITGLRPISFIKFKVNTLLDAHVVFSVVINMSEYIKLIILIKLYRGKTNEHKHCSSFSVWAVCFDIIWFSKQLHWGRFVWLTLLHTFWPLWSSVSCSLLLWSDHILKCRMTVTADSRLQSNQLLHANTIQSLQRFTMRVQQYSVHPRHQTDQRGWILKGKPVEHLTWYEAECHFMVDLNFEMAS